MTQKSVYDPLYVSYLLLFVAMQEIISTAVSPIILYCSSISADTDVVLILV